MKDFWYPIECAVCRELIAKTQDSLMFTSSIHCVNCAEQKESETE